MQIFRNENNWGVHAFHKIHAYTSHVRLINAKRQLIVNEPYLIARDAMIFRLHVLNEGRGTDPVVDIEDREFWEDATLEFSVPSWVGPRERIRVIRALPKLLLDAGALDDREHLEFDAAIQTRFPSPEPNQQE